MYDSEVHTSAMTEEIIAEKGAEVNRKTCLSRLCRDQPGIYAPMQARSRRGVYVPAQARSRYLRHAAVLYSCCASGLHSRSTGGLRVPAFGTYTPGSQQASTDSLRVPAFGTYIPGWPDTSPAGTVVKHTSPADRIVNRLRSPWVSAKI